MKTVITSADLYDDELDTERPFASIRRVISKVGKGEFVQNEETGEITPVERAVVYVVQPNVPWWRTKIGEEEFSTFKKAEDAVKAELKG